MTQVNRAQDAHRKLASTPRARVRSVAQHRADFEDQVRLCLANDTSMALTEPKEVSARMKELRKRAGNPGQLSVAQALNVPYRTFQSWENAEVETDKANYTKVARYYSRVLKEKVTANWILFGQDNTPPIPNATPDLSAALSQNGDQPQQLDRIEANQTDLKLAVAALESTVSTLAGRITLLEKELREQRTSKRSRGTRSKSA